MKRKISKVVFAFLLPIACFLLVGFFSFANIFTESAFAISSGGGILYVGNKSTLNMTSGSLSGASSSFGGAVCVASGGTFNMSGGTISENSAKMYGGGVIVNSGGTFNLSGGAIYNNTSMDSGKDIKNDGTFTMTGGVVGSGPAYTIVDKDGNENLSGKYVLFGSYPQTKIANGVSVDETDVDDNGYFLGSDGKRYAKLDTNYYMVEPVLWQIINEADGNAILIPVKILEEHRYDETYADYAQSEIRTWLNSDFYNKVFSSQEKNIVQKTSIEGDINDNVSLVTGDIIEKSGFDWFKVGTDYSIDNGLVVGTSGGSSWWFLYGKKSNIKYVRYVEIAYVVNSNGESDSVKVSPAGTGAVPMVTIQFSRVKVSSSGNGIYNTGTMNLYGGTIYDGIGSSSTINTKMSANILGTITLGNSADIVVQDYAGITPKYTISVYASRGAGTLITFVGSDTEPDISALNVSGFDAESYTLKTKKDNNGNWTIILHSFAMDFPTTWKDEIASSDYMTTTVTPTDLTSIQFVSSVPDGYTQIGTLSTGLPVYQGSTATEIAFVAKKIYAPEDCYQLFYNLTKLTSIEFDVFDTSKVTNMSYMFGARVFYNGPKFNNLHLSNFDTSKVTNMSYMFYGCSSLTNLDLSNFDTLKVTNMSYMFYGCSNLTNLGLSKFDTSKVTNMNHMFYKCSKITSIDVSNFDTLNVTDMGQMFSDCTALTSINVSNFNTSKVTNMSNMFSYCSGLTSLDVTNFDTRKVVDMTYLFCCCSGLTSLDVTNFITTNVTSMWGIFSNCSSLTSIDVGSFDTSKVTDMRSMFSNCSGLTNLDISKFITSSVTDISAMFDDCSGLTSLDLSNFNTTNVTDMHSMFYGCSGLTNLDLSTFDTSKVTRMDSMFYGCSNLTSLDLSNFDTSEVTNMSHMFYKCTVLQNVDVSGFDTSKVTDMSYMFYYCLGLTSLEIDNFNTTNVTSMSFMFRGCSGLKTLDISSFNMVKITSISDMLDFGSSNKIETLKTPYGNAFEISITTGSMLYDAETGKRVSSVPGKITKSLTYVNVNPNADFPSTWKSDVASTKYMSTTITPENLTSIKFVSFVPSGYTQIGTLSTGLPVYKGWSINDIAFVAGKIFAPELSNALFSLLAELSEIDFSAFDTSKVTQMASLFFGCESLTALDLSVFDTSKVIYMTNMFGECEKIRNLDLSSFDLSQLSSGTYPELRFYNIYVLKTPYGNTVAIPITTGSTLYNKETGAVVTSIPANSTASMTLTSTPPSSFLAKENDLISDLEENCQRQNDIFFEKSKKEFQFQVLKVEG